MIFNYSFVIVNCAFLSPSSLTNSFFPFSPFIYNCETVCMMCINITVEVMGISTFFVLEQWWRYLVHSIKLNAFNICIYHIFLTMIEYGSVYYFCMNEGICTLYVYEWGYLNNIIMWNEWRYLYINEDIWRLCMNESTMQACLALPSTWPCVDE